MAVTIPLHIQRYFWGDDLSVLSWENHRHYIVQTLLDKGDIDALSWLFYQTTKDEVRRSLSSFRLSQKSNNFWKTYLS
ncbi:MAG: hypothetical protein AAB492_01340 [Patescibacteria group bacterium]